jgi:3-oxoadipate enol-lactonase
LRERLVNTNAAAYAASCEAVAGIDFRASNGGIQCPALVIAGTRDEATPVAMSEAIRSSIPGAQLQTLPAAHLSAVEQPADFAGLLARFFEGLR